MTVNEQKHYCGVIAAHYGRRSQEYQAAQELSELMCLLTRRDDQRDSTYKERVTDEIADCEIMLEQIRRLNGIDEAEVAEHISQKIERQLQRMQAEKEREENEP